MFNQRGVVKKIAHPRGEASFVTVKSGSQCHGEKPRREQRRVLGLLVHLVGTSDDTRVEPEMLAQEMEQKPIASGRRFGSGMRRAFQGGGRSSCRGWSQVFPFSFFFFFL